MRAGYGTTVDANIQKEVYRRDPLRGSVPREAIAAVISLFVVAAILLWASASDERISAALIPFLVVNVVAWKILVHRVEPVINASAHCYQQESRVYRLEQLRIIHTYIAGSWQWLRFTLMALIVLAANLFCFNDTAREAAARTLHTHLPSNFGGVSEAAISALLPTAILAVFITVAETWIWILRARNAIALRTITTLARRYAFRPRETSPV